jgi:hypothetical protein
MAKLRYRQCDRPATSRSSREVVFLQPRQGAAGSPRSSTPLETASEQEAGCGGAREGPAAREGRRLGRDEEQERRRGRRR